MLYTNTELEIFNDSNKGRILEIANIYGKSCHLPVKEGNLEKLSLVKFPFNDTISIDIDGNNSLSVVDDNTKEDLFIILDMFSYKRFSKNSVLLCQEGLSDDERFESLSIHRYKNRSDRRVWCIHILKAPKGKDGILKMQKTSGDIEYLIILNGKINIFDERTAKLYLRKHKSKMFIDNMKWELLRKRR
ncbi:MAG: hypothetical protein ACRCXT_06205 [Paraclostridium sp.]